MSFNFNHLTISGNLTRDPELKQIGNSQVLNVVVAVNDDYYDKQTQQTKEQTYFLDVAIWGKMATSLSSMLSKGSKVFLEGKLIQKRWDDVQGNKRAKISINASKVILGGSKPQNHQNSNGNYNNNSQANQQPPNFQPGSQQPPWKPPAPQQTNFNDQLNRSDVTF